jgi:hypothetical protein
MLSQRPPANRRAGRALGTVLLLLAAPVLSQCDRGEERPESAPAPVVTEVEPAAPSLPRPRPPLDRAAILAAVDQAASEYASGAQAAGSDPLVGRPFALVSAFACEPLLDAAALNGLPDGVARAGWGPERRTIQLTLRPGDWLQSALMADQGQAGQWETVEGFWLSRPWQKSEACPAVSRDPLSGEAGAPDAETAGIAAVFGSDSSRIGQRNGRAYVHTIRPSDDEASLVRPSAGYRSRVEGRVAAFPNGRAVRCRAAGPDRRPVCVMAVTLDRFAFTTAEGAVLSEWRPG